MAYTPHDGLHIYFSARPEFTIYCSTGVNGLGPGLDVRGERGSITLPSPGSGYSWDETQNLETTPLLKVPTWLAYKPPRQHREAGEGGWPLTPVELLVWVCDQIRSAGPGERHQVLNRHAFLAGTLVGRHLLDEALAWDQIKDAAIAMCWATSGDPRKTQRDLESAFRDGITRGGTGRSERRPR